MCDLESYYVLFSLIMHSSGFIFYVPFLTYMSLVLIWILHHHAFANVIGFIFWSAMVPIDEKVAEILLDFSCN